MQRANNDANRQRETANKQKQQLDEGLTTKYLENNKSVFSRIPWLWTRHCPRLLLSAELRPCSTAARLTATKLCQSCYTTSHFGTDRRTPYRYHVVSANEQIAT